MKTILASLLLSLSLGCGAEPADPQAGGTGRSLGGKADGVSGDPLPGDDETVQFMASHPFGAFAFMDRCVSKKDGAPPVEGDKLPVGGGSRIECTTYAALDRSTLPFKDDHEGYWCVLGEVGSGKPKGDARVVVTITARPIGQPWTVTATREGDEILLEQVEALGIAKTWPIWIDLAYTPVSLKRDPGVPDCMELFK